LIALITSVMSMHPWWQAEHSVSEVPVISSYRSPKIGSGIAGRRGGLRHGKKLTATGQLLFSAAIAEEAVIADALEALGEGVEKEASDELGGGQRHCLRPVGVAVILPPSLPFPVTTSRAGLYVRAFRPDARSPSIFHHDRGR
jgi:hypothetical protein